ncbi:MAG: hypothetical protein IJG30_06450, partial [Synergistaceae bacterium]|nr:hypothetical protein [Synergistaceae bacterium]
GFNDLPDCVRSRLSDDETLRHMRFQMLTFKPEFSREILEGCYSTKTGRCGMDSVDSPFLFAYDVIWLLFYHQMGEKSQDGYCAAVSFRPMENSGCWQSL